MKRIRLQNRPEAHYLLGIIRSVYHENHQPKKQFRFLLTLFIALERLWGRLLGYLTPWLLPAHCWIISILHPSTECVRKSAMLDYWSFYGHTRSCSRHYIQLSVFTDSGRALSGGLLL